MVFEKLREILADELELSEDDITMESDLVEDLGADSMAVVDLIMSIEDEFGVEVPDEDVEKEIEDEAKRSGQTVENFKKSLNDRVMEIIRQNTKLRKVVNQIKASAEVEVKDAAERVDASQVASDVMQALEDTEEAEGTEEDQ